MVRAAGFEPDRKPSKIKASSLIDSPLNSPDFGIDPDLTEVARTWPNLPAALRLAVLAIIRSYRERETASRDNGPNPASA